ncbi:MAG: aminomethyl-transferring glycine dehydrogenase subunit GcvPB [Firmicutes bacterium]|nr:aminomethyl-transferring glycine dehydrogenase subunit GcvPB [Bacillota bacterium]
MELIFEKSRPGRGLSLLPACDVPAYAVPEEMVRSADSGLPEVAEVDLVRHYQELAERSFSPAKGLCPMGSCTMKYNPQVDELAAELPGFTQIHPLQPKNTTEGCREATDLLKHYLCAYTGMDGISLQPAAGSHGEFAGMLIMKAYHAGRGEAHRDKILVPDSAHGTNPASAAMAGFRIVNIPSTEEGLVDLDALRAAAGEDTAGLMLTNPNTLGLFERDILEITGIVHEAGGLCYYDGANLNAILGVARPGDMGFDIVHLNLHKTFAAPHGGGGPGSGPVGYKAFLEKYVPQHLTAFYGNFLVEMKALAYALTIGRDGAYPVAASAVLNARYLMQQLSDVYRMAGEPCMHEFVISAADLKAKYGVTAKDIVKALFDHRMHAPNMYFPLIVEEALMVEPSETESRETLDRAARIFREIYHLAQTDPDYLKAAPHTTPVGRPDEVQAAVKPVLKYEII